MCLQVDSSGSLETINDYTSVIAFIILAKSLAY